MCCCFVGNFFRVVLRSKTYQSLRDNDPSPLTRKMGIYDGSTAGDAVENTAMLNLIVATMKVCADGRERHESRCTTVMVPKAHR